MEHATAQFVVMVMERLQAVEEQNVLLQNQNRELRGMVSTGAQTGFLKEDLMTFNDGMKLIPAFGEGDARLCPSESLSWFLGTTRAPSWTLDTCPLHANAAAFYGRLSFDFGFREWPHSLIMGGFDQRTSVKEFAKGIDEWCKQCKAQHPETHVTDAMKQEFQGWRYASENSEQGLVKYVLKD